MPEDATGTIIRFGEFELDCREGILRKGAAPIKLQPQPFRVLAFLAENAGHLVTRGELQRHIWANETFVDFEHGLNYCVRQVREALADSAKSPRYIETVPRHGYRFIAQVVRPPERQQRGNSPPVGFTQPPRRVRYLIVTLISLAALLLLIYSVGKRQGLRTKSDRSKTLLVVLPLRPVTSEVGLGDLSDNLTGEMTNAFRRLRPGKIDVISPEKAEAYKSDKDNAQEIGDELGADYVLEGTVNEESYRVHISIRLLDMHDPAHPRVMSYAFNYAGGARTDDKVARDIIRLLLVDVFAGDGPGVVA